jgi:hypothetical protein
MRELEKIQQRIKGRGRKDGLGTGIIPARSGEEIIDS